MAPEGAKGIPSALDIPTQARYSLFASTKRAPVRKSEMKTPTPVPRAHPKKKQRKASTSSQPKISGSQFSVVISDSESEGASEGDRKTGPSDDEEREEIGAQQNKGYKESERYEGGATSSEPDVPIKPARSRNMARCSRGKRPLKLQSQSSLLHRVPSFKPLNFKAAQSVEENGGTDVAMEARVIPRPTRPIDSSPDREPKSPLHVQAGPEDSSGSEDYHDPTQTRRSSPEVVAGSPVNSSKKRKIDGDSSDDGEEQVDGVELEGAGLASSERYVSTDSAPEKVDKRIAGDFDSDDGEDDTRVALELTSSIDALPKAGMPATRCEGDKDIIEEICDEMKAPRRHISMEEYVKREEMERAIEQMEQKMKEQLEQMRGEMAEREDAHRIAMKRMIRAEIKDEVLLSQDLRK